MNLGNIMTLLVRIDLRLQIFKLLTFQFVPSSPRLVAMYIFYLRLEAYFSPHLTSMQPLLKASITGYMNVFVSSC